MNRLARRISRAIDTGGPLSIAAFMAMALHDREDGFYASREAIGARGAFVTAPEISQMFGELLGLWCVQAWRDQGAPRRAYLVELGPGRATLIQDALRAARLAPDFLGSIEVVLVEAGAAQQALQRERMRDAPVAIRWIEQWSAIASDRPIFVLANEFLDALPVLQFVMTERGWCERVITANGTRKLAFALAPDPTMLEIPNGRGAAEPGAVYEVSPASLALIDEVSGGIGRRGGAALFIDYGYCEGGFGETLQAVRQHKPADLLDAPGEADLSAHVDFAALARAAKSAGTEAHGPLSQGDFLRALGIEERAAELAARNPEHGTAIASAIDRLTGEAAMGKLFKAIAIVPRGAPAPPGF
ncbi:MAG TPA: SAM-dependent methyltransferase [Rhizomicrobium sp.]|jgi:NADH dehydrogenase [ubiquinone] 1 alpha subcomplex assembly factor 7